jgi:hypothetical protein
MTAWSRWFDYIFYFCCHYKNILYTDKQYEIIKKVRNHYYLELEDLQSLNTFSKEQLIEIIEIVNTNTIRMNELIQYME